MGHGKISVAVCSMYVYVCRTGGFRMHVMCADICTLCCKRCVHLGRIVRGIHMNAS